MTSYNLGKLGIAESRWTGQGQTITKDGQLILYFGHESQNMYGVAINILKRHQFKTDSLGQISIKA